MVLYTDTFECFSEPFIGTCELKVSVFWVYLGNKVQFKREVEKISLSASETYVFALVLNPCNNAEGTVNWFFITLLGSGSSTVILLSSRDKQKKKEKS